MCRHHSQACRLCSQSRPYHQLPFGSYSGWSAAALGGSLFSEPSSAAGSGAAGLAVDDAFLVAFFLLLAPAATMEHAKHDAAKMTIYSQIGNRLSQPAHFSLLPPLRCLQLLHPGPRQPRALSTLTMLAHVAKLLRRCPALKRCELRGGKLDAADVKDLRSEINASISI